jgi:hypothetical protein
MNPALARFLARLGLLGPDRLRILVRADRVRIETHLLVECVGGTRQPVKFVIDSGCSVTTLDLALAQSLGMPTTGPKAPKHPTGSGGRRTITVVEGAFRFWLSQDQRAAPFVAPIYFEENRPTGVPPLFGLKGIIDQLRWTIGPCRPALDGVLGCCLLEDVRPAAERYPS